MSPIFKNFQAR